MSVQEYNAKRNLNQHIVKCNKIIAKKDAKQREYTANDTQFIAQR